MSKQFTARWPFACGCCGVEQAEGTIAEYGSDGMLRNVEADHTSDDYGSESHGEPLAGRTRHIEVMPRGKTAQDRCNRCFIVHATNQEECY